MKFCGKCGAQIMDEAVFCPKCGCSTGYTPVIRVETQMPANTYRATLKTNRGVLKFILLSLITLGIYGIVVMSQVSTDINVIATKYDGKKTTHYCLMFFLLSWLTLGIYPLIWFHMISDRIGTELYRRSIGYHFGAGTYWGWGFFGILIIVGPFIYHYKLFKSMNLLAEDFNRNG